MFLHLGEDLSISTSKIIAILSNEAVCKSEISRRFLNSNKSNIIHISDNSPKAFVVTDEQIYLSPISSATLRKRINYNVKNNRL